MIVLAAVRDDIAKYVDALFYVYILIIFLYILLNLVFSLGARIPYSRASDAFLTFLRDVSEPYLRLFRRFIPAVGMFDFSPVIAIFVLYFLRAADPQLDRWLTRAWRPATGARGPGMAAPAPSCGPPACWAW